MAHQYPGPHDPADPAQPPWHLEGQPPQAVPDGVYPGGVYYEIHDQPYPQGTYPQAGYYGPPAPPAPTGPPALPAGPSAYHQAPPSGYGQAPHPGAGYRALPPGRLIPPDRGYEEPGGRPPRDGRRSSRSSRGYDDRRERSIRIISWLTTGRVLIKWTAVVVVLLLAWQVVGGFLLGGSRLGKLIHSPVGIVESIIHGATKTTTSDTVIGNAILEQVVGLDKPPLGQANLSFNYQHKVDKSKLFWKCWYSQDYHAEATAWAYVNLNPGAKWWAPKTGHYVMHRVGHQVSVVLSLPQPTLAPSVHQVSVDMTLSGAVGKPDHSFSYPGLGCGTVMNPHFSNDAMGKDMQTLAYTLVTGRPVTLDGITMLPGSDTSSVIRQRLFNSAKAEAQKIWAIDAVGPTVAHYGDHLQSLKIVWVPQSPN